MKRQILTISLLVLILYSCQKEISFQRDVSSNARSSSQVDVYVAGYVSDDVSYDDVGYPTYWKNGNPVKIDNDLPNSDYGYIGGRALSIAVSGNDVYVAGTGVSVGPYRISTAGILWTNGIRDIYNTSELNSLKVSNNDVYMAGFREGIWGTGDPATYYKNGSSVDIVDGSAGSDATSITVSGNDVYVAGVGITGSVFNGSQKLFAKYWKNGNPVNLTDGSNFANAWSIVVSGSDVYVAGTEWNGKSYRDANGNTNRNGIAKYWKNTKAINLTDGSTDANANSIIVSGTDVYVAGTQWNGNVYHDSYGNEHRDPVATYWKNGKPVNLTDGSKWAEANSIAVSGSDVYVAGFEETQTGSEKFVAKYWKNGNAVILGDVSKNSKAYSIFLAPK